MGTVERALWLPPVATAVLAWLAHDAGYEAEAGTRAGAEPSVAGILFATPFVLVALTQAGCAGFATLAVTSAQRWACVASSSTGAVLLLVLATTWDGIARADEVVVLAGTLLPLVPVWVALVAPRSPGRRRTPERQLDQRRPQT